MSFCKVTLPHPTKRESLINSKPLAPWIQAGLRDSFSTNRIQWKSQRTTAKIRSENAYQPLPDSPGMPGLQTPTLGTRRLWCEKPKPHGGHMQVLQSTIPAEPSFQVITAQAPDMWARKPPEVSGSQPSTSPPVIGVFPAEAPDVVKQQHAFPEFLDTENLWAKENGHWVTLPSPGWFITQQSITGTRKGG